MGKRIDSMNFSQDARLKYKLHFSRRNKKAGENYWGTMSTVQWLFLERVESLKKRNWFFTSVIIFKLNLLSYIQEKPLAQCLRHNRDTQYMITIPHHKIKIRKGAAKYSHYWSPTSSPHFSKLGKAEVSFWRADCLFYSLLYLQDLEECLAHNRHSINNCWTISWLFHFLPQWPLSLLLLLQYHWILRPRSSDRGESCTRKRKEDG